MLIRYLGNYAFFYAKIMIESAKAGQYIYISILRVLTKKKLLKYVLYMKMTFFLVFTKKDNYNTYYCFMTLIIFMTILGECFGEREGIFLFQKY